jgi:hypothetical protein
VAAIVVPGARKGAAGALDLPLLSPCQISPTCALDCSYGTFTSRRICARRSSIHVQSMRGPIGEMMARRSAMSSAVSNGGFAYEDDILEDAIL